MSELLEQPIPELALAVPDCEREDAERAVRESEARLRFSLEAGRLGFWQHNLATDALICSDLCKIHFGRHPDEPMTHHDVLSTVHPEDLERVRAAIRSAIAQREGYVLEYRVIWPDNSVRWLMIRGCATYTAAGSAETTFGVTLDITERRNAEARQAEQAERLRLLSECAASLLQTADPENTVRDLFQRLRASLRLDLYLHYVSEGGGPLRLASHAGLSAEAVERLASPAPGDSLTNLHWPALRELGMHAISSHPLQVGERLLGLLLFAGREPWTEEQVEFLRTISHYVAAAQERARVEESLRDAARRKDEFLAMLAHELRNPLAPVANALEILRACPGSAQSERARGVVERQMGNMRRLIEDLLDVSRITTGKITLKKERLDLVEAVQHAIESVRGFIAECGHQLEVRLPNAPLFAELDPVRLEQVVTNLLNNAAKYTERGGTITVEVDAGEGEWATLRVRDTGIGIPAGLLGQVFDLFTQGERGLDRSQGGLGLGLTLVRNLVDLHGGTVEACSDGPGRGSEFVVRIPLRKDEGGRMTDEEEAARVAAQVHPSSVYAPDSRRVLVVDDNRDSAETLAELAELWGYQVAVAHDGLTALHQAQRWEPAVIFLDIGMPGLNGYEVARRLRQDERFRQVLLVALTGYGQEEDVARSREAGFDHHLVKPVEPGQLQALLYRHLSPASV